MRGLARGVTLLLLGSMGFGCEGMKDLFRLQSELAEAFRTPELTVNLHTSGTLTVTLQNSPLDGKDSDEEQATCRKVAEFVRDHYGHYATVRVVQVGFASRWEVAAASFTRGRVPCRFTHEDLGEPEPRKPAPDSARPAA
jgi:hypothetical protein